MSQVTTWRNNHDLISPNSNETPAGDFTVHFTHSSYSERVWYFSRCLLTSWVQKECYCFSCYNSFYL